MQMTTLPSYCKVISSNATVVHIIVQTDNVHQRDGVDPFPHYMMICK